MTCPRCGADLPDGARFCPACGAGLFTPLLLDHPAVPLDPFTRVLEVRAGSGRGHLQGRRRRLARSIPRCRRSGSRRACVPLAPYIGDAVMAVFGAPLAPRPRSTHMSSAPFTMTSVTAMNAPFLPSESVLGHYRMARGHPWCPARQPGRKLPA
ncbi:MAG: zinc ribbon domain-containing protein [Actinobacteria bacterium]|nr:zinc ribbon domain-containing protein [Actinomycetota bacterium]